MNAIDIWGPTGRGLYGSYIINPATGKKVAKAAPARCKTADEARAYFESLPTVSTVETGLKVDYPTIANLFETWLSIVKADPKQTDGHDRSEKLGRKYLLPKKFKIADLDLNSDEARPSVIEQWIKLICQQPNGKGGTLAPFSINNVVWILRRFYLQMNHSENPLTKLPYLKRNPFTEDPLILKAMPEIEKTYGRAVIHLLEHEVIKLISAECPLMPFQFRVKHILALCTGMRDGELHGLRWSDIKLNDPIPYLGIERQFDQEVQELRDPKYDSFRELPLHPLAIQALKALSESRENHGNDDYVFPNSVGDAFTPRSARIFRDHLAMAGLSIIYRGIVQFNMKATRATFTNLLEAAEVHHETRGALLGHAGNGVERRYYMADNIKKFLPAIMKLPFPHSIDWLSKPQTDQRNRHPGPAKGTKAKPRKTVASGVSKGRK